MRDTPTEYDYCVIGGGIAGLYLVSALIKAGKRVALVEAGPEEPGAMRAPRPSIVASGRPHLGVTAARNQVLGGNAHVWGGGLMRTDAKSAAGALGVVDRFAGSQDEDLTVDFRAVSEAIHVSRFLDRRPMPARNPVWVGEIGVLPGRGRNVAATLLPEIRASKSCDRFCNAVVGRFIRDGASRVVRGVVIQTPHGSRQLDASVIVISAGAADSNLLVAKHASDLGIERADTIGTRIHDHFSLPLYRIVNASRRFREFIAPRFDAGMIVARHYEIEASEGWGARGFLHFQFLFDEVSPYRQIKTLLSLRQQQAGRGTVALAAAAVLGDLPGLMRIGYERYSRKALHIGRDVPIVATLDFESFPSEKNSISWNAGAATLDWNIRPEDIESFHALRNRAETLLDQFQAEYGLVREQVADMSTLEAAETHFRNAATDAFHLGGGLQASAARDGLVDTNLRLSGTENVFVISTAAFRRPGVANPTFTLLALANRFVRQQLALRP